MNLQNYLEACPDSAWLVLGAGAFGVLTGLFYASVARMDAAEAKGNYDDASERLDPAIREALTRAEEYEQASIRG